MLAQPVSSLFGIPLVIRRVDAEQLIHALAELWNRQMGREPVGLRDDLDALRTFFDPLATGDRLRRLLATLQPAPPVRARLLREPLVLQGGDEILITLEGRLALEVIRELLLSNSNDPLMIDPETVCIGEREVAERYRKWSTRRLQDVLLLKAGEAEALRPSSIAWLLFLLVNGSRSPETAIKRPLSHSDEEKLDQSIRRIISSFANALTSGSRDDRHFSIYQGYALTEARRRLPGVLGAKDPYIAQGREDQVLDLIVLELSRPQRSPSVEQVMNAFDQLVEVYRKERPSLALLGLAHEKRTVTRQIRQRLEEAIEQNRRRSGTTSPSSQGSRQG